MRSADGGKTWFMLNQSLLEFQNRTFQTPKLSDKEKGWLDMIELPLGHNVAAAMGSRERSW